MRTVTCEATLITIEDDAAATLATALSLPIDPLETWNAPTVKAMVTLPAGRFQATIRADGDGAALIPLSRSRLAQSGLEPGDRVEVRIDPIPPGRAGDEAHSPLPANLARALAAQPDLLLAWKRLPDHQRLAFLETIRGDPDARAESARPEQLDTVLAILRRSASADREAQ